MDALQQRVSVQLQDLRYVHCLRLCLITPCCRAL
jgi:hypothetical protein